MSRGVKGLGEERAKKGVNKFEFYLFIIIITIISSGGGFCFSAIMIRWLLNTVCVCVF